MYDQAFVTADQGSQQPLELLEDVNAIAVQVLQQRMVSEMSKSLLRVALKQAAAYQVEKESAFLGLVVSSANFLTEKADTRNWQTLPHSIYYTRIRLSEGNHSLGFSASSRQHPDVEQHQEVVISLPKGHTAFHVVNSPYTAPQ